MTISGPRLRTMLRQAERAKEAGKLAAAEQSYREILAEAPEASEAWAGLADVLIEPQDKEAAYEKALALDAGNQEAVLGLAKLRGESLPSEVEEPERVSPPVVNPVKREKTAVSPPIASNQPAKPEEEAFELHCYRHPDRVTSLRCYSCNKPICVSCTNKTPVGYICPECKYEAEEKFFNARPLDYLIAGGVSFILSLIAGVIVVRFGGGFFWILLVLFFAGAVGGFIGKLTQRVIGGRRGRYLPYLVAAMVIVGVVIPALPYLLAVLAGGVGALVGLLVPGIYAFIAASSAFYWMR